MDIASKFLSNEGFLITVCIGEHFGKVAKYASAVGLHFHCTWIVICDFGYIHPITCEEVIFFIILLLLLLMLNQVQICDLGWFYFLGVQMPLPYYDRKAKEIICPKIFLAMRSFIVQSQAPCTCIKRSSKTYHKIFQVLLGF